MPSRAEEITVAEQRLGRLFPADFRDFFIEHGPGSVVDTTEAYAEVWPINDIIAVNGVPEVRQLFPDLIRFGGDGSRELLAFDYRTEPPRVVLVDITGST